MEHETKMMCPFRRKDNGDFEPCYGKGCMAYMEWPSYVFDETGANSTGNGVISVACRMLAPHCNTAYPVTGCSGNIALL